MGRCAGCPWLLAARRRRCQLLVEAEEIVHELDDDCMRPLASPARVEVTDALQRGCSPLEAVGKELVTLAWVRDMGEGDG